MSSLQRVKAWDKSSKKYRWAKWLYLNFLFYFVNVDTFGKRKKIPKIIGGQHLDAEQLEYLISPTDGAVIDIGAERGEMANYFYGLGFKVYAIEPEKKNWVYLWLHNWFRVLLGRFRIYRLACGETSGSATLYVSDLSFRHSLEQGEYAGGKQQAVRQVRAGEFINQRHLYKIALLKIDAEGFDLPILRGLFASTAVKPKTIMFEAGPENIREMVDLAKQQGYQYFRIICRWNEQPGVSFQKRIAVYDGLDPEVFSVGSNVICSTTDFRILNPLV